MNAPIDSDIMPPLEPSHQAPNRPGRWLIVIALAAVGLMIFAASCRRIWNTDFWWQYKTGQLVAEHGIPHQDTFSYTRHGAEYIELRWIFCYCLYQLMRLFGPAGVILTQCAAMLATFGLLAAMPGSRKALPATALAATIAVLAASQRFQCRPEQVSFLFLAAFLWLIDMSRCRSPRWAIAIPFLQIIWSNSHTIFILGPLVVGAWLVGALLDRFLAGPTTAEPPNRPSEIRVASMTLAATLPACLLNPYGWRGIAFTFQLATEIHGTAFKNNISEFADTFSLSQDYTAVLFLKLLIALAVLSAVINWRRIDRFLLIVCLAMGYLSFTAIRNLPLFAIAAVPFVAQNMARSQLWLRPFARRCLPAGRIIACTAAILVSTLGAWSNMTDRFHVRQNDNNQFGISLANNRFPIEAFKFFTEHNLKGPVFNTMMEGGYLLANDVPVFIDSRLEVYGEEFFLDFLRMMADPADWNKAVNKYDFRVLFVELGFAASGLVSDNPNWPLVYFDDVIAIYVRSDCLAGLPVIGRDVPFEPSLQRAAANHPPVKPIDDTSPFARVSSPFAAYKLAMFLYNMQQFAAALPFVDDAITIKPDFAPFFSLRAKIMDQLKRLPDAIAAYEEAVRLDPTDTTSRGLLGRRYFSSNDFDRAAPLLEASVEAIPDNAVNWALLTRIYLSRSKLDQALNSARRSVEFDPTNAQYRKDLAKIYLALGEIEPMIPAFLEAARLAPDDCGIWRDMLGSLIKMKRIDRARPLADQVPPACRQSPEVAEILKQLSSQ